MLWTRNPTAVCHNGQSASLLSAFGLGHVFSTRPAPSASAPCILAILTHLRVRVKICILTHPPSCLFAPEYGSSRPQKEGGGRGLFVVRSQKRRYICPAFFIHHKSILIWETNTGEAVPGTDVVRCPRPQATLPTPTDNVASSAVVRAVCQVAVRLRVAVCS